MKKKSVISSIKDQCFIKLAVSPSSGRANTELLDMLAKVLGVKKDNISLEWGHNSKNKMVLVKNIGGDEVYTKLLTNSS